jgi:hypothetical protein
MAINSGGDNEFALPPGFPRERTPAAAPGFVTPPLYDPQLGHRQPLGHQSLVLGLYSVVEERDDYLVVKGYDPNNRFHEDGKIRTGYIAKPELLVKSRWDGETQAIDGIDVSYAYNPNVLGERTAKGVVNNEVVEEVQKITPGYFPGDIIMAVKTARPESSGVSYKTEQGQTLDWVDMNVSGRAWAVETESSSGVSDPLDAIDYSAQQLDPLPPFKLGGTYSLGSLSVTTSLLVDGPVTFTGASVTVSDSFMRLANANDADSIDMGFYGKYVAGTVAYSGIFRDATDGKIKVFKDLQEEPTSTVNIGGTGYAVGTLVANLEGTVTGTVSDISNHASTGLSDVGAKTGSGTTLVFNASPTIVTPTIASFANATHDHTDAAGGGTLSTSAIGTGTFADARISQSSVTQHAAAIDHDALTNFVANEHIDWTSTSANLSTTGTANLDGAVTINDSGAAVDFRVETDNETDMLHVDGTNDRIGIAFDPATAVGDVTIAGSPGTVNRYALGILKTYTDTSGQQSASEYSSNANPSGASTAATFGAVMAAGTTGGNGQNIDNNEAIVGGKFTARHRGTGVVKRLFGGSFTLANTSTGDITGSGSAAASISVGAGNLQANGGTVTDQFGIWAWSTVDKHYFAGNVGCGTDDPDTKLHVDGVVTLEEESSTPSNPTSGSQCRMYMKDDKLIIQYNDGGTVRYKYLDLTGTGVTWNHTTTAP